MPKHTNKYGYLIFFLIIAIPSFFIIANTIISNSSYDISYKRELPISMMDNKWDKDDGDLNLQSPLDNGGKKWTILFYGAHDNDLSASIPGIGSNDDIDVIALEDGLPWGDSRAAYVLSGGARIYINLSSINPSWTFELNMAHPDTLFSFVQYCIENYPAEHYWVVLDNHGGAYNGVCTDETSGGDILTIGDLKTAFSGIASYLGRKIDGIFFAACLMSNLEIAVQLSPYVGYIVGFETTSSGHQLDEDEVVTTFLANPSMSPREIAIELVDQAFITETGSMGMSAVKLSTIQDLIDDVNNLSTQLMNNFNIYGKEIRDVRNACEDWYGYPYQLVDFVDFIEEVYERVPNKMIRYYALDIMRNLVPSDQNYAIINNRIGSASDFMHGLSVYFPVDISTYSSHYQIENDFCALTHWGEFIQVFYANDVAGALTPFGNSYVFFIILGAVPLIIIGGRNVIFKKR